jgi:hypothetical protein
MIWAVRNNIEPRPREESKMPVPLDFYTLEESKEMFKQLFDNSGTTDTLILLLLCVIFMIETGTRTLAELMDYVPAVITTEPAMWINDDGVEVPLLDDAGNPQIKETKVGPFVTLKSKEFVETVNHVLETTIDVRYNSPDIPKPTWKKD